MKVNRFFVVLVSVLFLTAATGLDAAAAKSSDRDLSDYAERAQEAGEVLNEVMAIPDHAIPDELLARATAIAVIPDVVKGALGFGGRFGQGLVTHRGSDGKWSTPSFIEIGGGSFGLQIGVESADLVLVFTNEEGFRSILDGKLKLGADASIAAGPVGRRAAVGTDIRLDSAIWSYSRTKGAFAGVSLDGSVISIDDSANKKVYGKGLSAEDILLRNRVRINNTVRPFIAAVQKHARQAAPRTTQD
jgi:lipid-binding SYLF domain-containing protein